mmetsp:Transcript_13135/g.45951  ORF Transcript_13135/g.45951 Transcript_13135/m.45951 type:complete len:298 (+) Transcript_13135:729-1622(+)
MRSMERVKPWRSTGWPTVASERAKPHRSDVARSAKKPPVMRRPMWPVHDDGYATLAAILLSLSSAAARVVSASQAASLMVSCMAPRMSSTSAWPTALLPAGKFAATHSCENSDVKCVTVLCMHRYARYGSKLSSSPSASKPGGVRPAAPPAASAARIAAEASSAFDGGSLTLPQRAADTMTWSSRVMLQSGEVTPCACRLAAAVRSGSASHGMDDHTTCHLRYVLIDEMGVADSSLPRFCSAGAPMTTAESMSTVGSSGVTKEVMPSTSDASGSPVTDGADSCASVPVVLLPMAKRK